MLVIFLFQVPSIFNLWYVVELRGYLHVIFRPRVSLHSRNTGNMQSLVIKFNCSDRNTYMKVFLGADLPELAAWNTQRTSSQSPQSLYETSAPLRNLTISPKTMGKRESKRLRLPMSAPWVNISLRIRNESPSPGHSPICESFGLAINCFFSFVVASKLVTTHTKSRPSLAFPLQIPPFYHFNKSTTKSKAFWTPRNRQLLRERKLGRASRRCGPHDLASASASMFGVDKIEPEDERFLETLGSARSWYR